MQSSGKNRERGKAPERDKMKTYRLTIIDHKKPFNKAIVSMKYYNGLSAARKASPAKLNYCLNVKAFIGFDERFEYIVCEC